MILTDNKEYAIKAKYLTSQAKDDEVEYIHHDIGYNYRLTNIQAALGVAQLERLSEYLKVKKENYYYYKQQIDKITGLHLAEVPNYADNNYWMYALQIEKEKYGRDKEALMKDLSVNNIQTRPVWYLNHAQKPYVYCQHYRIEHALLLFEKSLNIPCSSNLMKSQINRVIKHL